MPEGALNSLLLVKVQAIALTAWRLTEDLRADGVELSLVYEALDGVPGGISGIELQEGPGPEARLGQKLLVQKLSHPLVSDGQEALDVV
jgi:hypothetical protein